LGFVPRAEMELELAHAGLELDQLVPLGKGYTTPHLLFAARRG
jgi:hypothetical protein